jgi:hypothetical protein
MAANVIHDLAPGIASGVIVEVSGHVLGRSLIDGLRRNIFPSGQVEQGDHYMDRSRELLQKHLKLIQLHEKDTILDYYEELVWQIHTAHRLADWMQQRANPKRETGEPQWFHRPKIRPSKEL